MGERFADVEKIGEGAFGKVFRAKDLSRARTVAIKIYRLEADDENFRQRILREAEVTSTIHDPHVIRSFEHGVVDEDPYIVFEYLPGCDLSELLEENQGSLPLPKASRIFLEILEGLEAAHLRGILHRDLKPDNIRLRDHQEVVLTDFGLAQTHDERSITETGMVMGTVAYMAPEIFEAKRPDERTDLYGAVLIYAEMVTGRIPLDAPRVPDVYQKRAKGGWRGLRGEGIEVPRALDQILIQCLHPDPKQRPRSARELRKQFERISFQSSRSGILSRAALKAQAEAAAPEPPGEGTRAMPSVAEGSDPSRTLDSASSPSSAAKTLDPQETLDPEGRAASPGGATQVGPSGAEATLPPQEGGPPRETQKSSRASSSSEVTRPFGAPDLPASRSKLFANRAFALLAFLAGGGSLIWGFLRPSFYPGDTPLSPPPRAAPKAPEELRAAAQGILEALRSPGSAIHTSLSIQGASRLKENPDLVVQARDRVREFQAELCPKEGVKLESDPVYWNALSQVLAARSLLEPIRPCHGFRLEADLLAQTPLAPGIRTFRAPAQFTWDRDSDEIEELLAQERARGRVWIEGFHLLQKRREKKVRKGKVDGGLSQICVQDFYRQRLPRPDLSSSLAQTSKLKLLAENIGRDYEEAQGVVPWEERFLSVRIPLGQAPRTEGLTLILSFGDWPLANPGLLELKGQNENRTLPLAPIYPLDLNGLVPAESSASASFQALSPCEEGTQAMGVWIHPALVPPLLEAVELRFLARLNRGPIKANVPIDQFYVLTQASASARELGPGLDQRGALTLDS